MENLVTFFRGGKGAKINQAILNPSHFERLLWIWRWMLNEGRIHYWLPIGFVTVDRSLEKEVTYQHLNLFLVEVSLVYISSWDPIQRAGVVWLHLSVGGWSGVCSIHCCPHRVSLLVECNAGDLVTFECGWLEWCLFNSLLPPQSQLFVRIAVW